MTRHTDTIAAHYAAAARGDLAAMTADFAPQISWVEAAGFPLGGTYIGSEQIIARVFTAMASEWEGFAMIADELIESGDTVIALGHYRGTHRDTGNPLNARAAHIWRFDAGKIVAFEQLTDTLLVARASATPIA